MKWDEFNQAFQDAKRTMGQADEIANSMAMMLQGRMPKVSNHYVLANLKKELSRYNVQTRRWKEEP